MKIGYIVVFSFAIVGLGYAGASYIHEDFRYYMLGGIVLLWLIAYFAMKYWNQKLASVMANLSEKEREEYLSKLDDDQRKDVNKSIEKLVEQNGGEE